MSPAYLTRIFFLTSHLYPMLSYFRQVNKEIHKRRLFLTVNLISYIKHHIFLTFKNDKSVCRCAISYNVNRYSTILYSPQISVPSRFMPVQTNLRICYRISFQEHLRLDLLFLRTLLALQKKAYLIALNWNYRHPSTIRILSDESVHLCYFNRNWTQWKLLNNYRINSEVLFRRIYFNASRTYVDIYTNFATRVNPYIINL